MTLTRTETGPLVAGAAPADAARLRQLCHGLLAVLESGDEGGPPGLAGELARVIGSGVGGIADGMRRELVAWEEAIASLRRLLPARYLGPVPAAHALLGEMEAAWAKAARVADALAAIRLDGTSAPADGPTSHPAGRWMPVTEPVGPPVGGRPNEPGPEAAHTVETSACELTREIPPPTDPRRAVELFRQGVEFQRRREFDRAEERYTEVIALDPRFSPAYSRRGQVRLARGADDAALADFDTALQLDDSAAEAWFWRGDAHAAGGRTDQAIADYTRALALRPDLGRARFNLGVALRQAGESSRALEEFTRLLAARPDHAAAYLNRGLIHLQRGDRGPAEHDFRSALRHDPGCEPAREQLAALSPAAPAPASPAPAALPPVSGERNAVVKKAANHLTVDCPSCGHAGEIPWDRLGKVFACTACKRRFGVRSDGTTVELVGTPDGKWVEAPKVRERSRQRRKRRLAVLGVATAALLLPAAGVTGWQVARSAEGKTERELPRELTARAELFTQAWLCNDVRLMRRLTTPAADRTVFAWYTRHRPPAALRSPTDGTPPEAARIDVEVRPGKSAQQSVTRVRVSDTKSAPDQAPAELSLMWEERGDSWFFVPPSK